MSIAETVAGKTLLSPTDHTLILVDFQPQMAFATKAIDGVVLCNNAALVANAAKGFTVSTILTTAAGSFSGPMFEQIVAAFPREDARSHYHEQPGTFGGDRRSQPHRQRPYRARRALDICLHRRAGLVGARPGFRGLLISP
jgi:nicotinamidase-related amidase